MAKKPKDDKAPKAAAPAALPDFPLKDLEVFLGTARVEKLKKLANGLYDQHAKEACRAAPDLKQACLELLLYCGVAVKEEELERAWSRSGLRASPC